MIVSRYTWKNSRHNLREHFCSPWQEGGPYLTSRIPRSPDWREKIFVPPWTRRCREGAFHGIFARCSYALRMQLAVEMLVPWLFLWNRFFFVWKNTGMWDEHETTDATFLRDPDSRSPQNKKETNHPRCILGDGVAWLVRCAFCFPWWLWQLDGSEILLTSWGW